MILREKRKLTRIGNGVAVFLPKGWLRALNVKVADIVNVELHKTGIFVKPSEGDKNEHERKS